MSFDKPTKQPAPASPGENSKEDIETIPKRVAAHESWMRSRQTSTAALLGIAACFVTMVGYAFAGPLGGSIGTLLSATVLGVLFYRSNKDVTRLAADYRLGKAR